MMTERTEEPKTQEQHSDRKWKILVVILTVLLLLTGGTMIFWGGVPFFPAFAPNDGGSASQGTGLVVDPNAGEYVSPTQSPGVTIPGFGVLTIPAHTQEVTGINLYNPEENKDLYYLTFTLALLDGAGDVSEILYASQLVPPGLYLQDISISRGLAAGTYDAVMKVQPYRVVDLTQTNNAELKLSLIVI